ncbi:MAG: S8 family serine peptidase [Deinococcota bacterium]
MNECRQSRLKNHLKLLVLTISLLGFIGCDSSTPTLADPGFTLNYPRAARGETLTASLQNLDGLSVSISVAGVSAPIVSRTPEQVSFQLPSAGPAGVQPLRIAQGSRIAEGQVTVFGDVVPDKVTVLVQAGTTRAQLDALATSQGFQLDQFRTLGGAGLCSANIAELDIAGTPFVEALANLEANDIVLNADPRGGYRLDVTEDLVSTNHLASAEVLDEHARGITGQGVTIAVLDTGVSPHPELAGRILPGLDLVNGDDDPTDDFDDPETNFNGDGHGTAVAVLAAGSNLGVAPEASILPIKVCDETGVCSSSDVAVGMCAALNQLPPESLVINLSLGGDTPVTLLEELINYATSEGAVVAAAAGNKGLEGSPQHYPAAFDQAAVVAVAALETTPPRCVSFDTLPPNTSFTVGDTFSESGIDVTVASFILEGEPPLADPPFVDGTALVEVGNVGSVDGAGNSLVLDRVNLELDFSESVSGVRLSISDYTPNLNVEVNGEFRNHTDSLRALAGQELGGVQLDVLDEPGGQSLLLVGNLRRLSIGLRSGRVDNLCEQAGAGSDWQTADFSTRGDYVDVAAPGAGVTSGTPQGGTLNFEGTSFATPQVAGALALWRQVNPELASDALASQLTSQAAELLADRDEVGAGRLVIDLEP